MTTIGLDRESTDNKFSVVNIVNVSLMILALSFSIWLLNWAVSNKLSRTEVTGTSQVTAEM